MRQYVNERLKILDGKKNPPTAEQTEWERMFETLQGRVSKPELRQEHENSWIRPWTWVLIDQRATFRKEGCQTMAKGRRLNRQIKAALKADRIERTRWMGEALMGSLTSGNVKEAWRTLQGWYREAGEKAPKQ